MKRDNTFERLWHNDNWAYWTGQGLARDHASIIPETIVALDHLMEDIRKSKRDPFSVSRLRNGKPVVKPTPLGTRIVEAVHQREPYLVRSLLPRHRFSPYFELWERNNPALCDAIYGRHVSVSDVEQANKLVHRMRLEANTSTFREVVRRQERASAKNDRSIRRYLNDQFAYCASRLLVVRVDLTYPTDPYAAHGRQDITDERVKSELTAQLRFVQRKLDYLTGYVWKIEYGALRNYHCHLLLLFDGHRRREGVTLGKMVGDHWMEVTHGEGTYWNCNANEIQYRHRGLRGIGLINWDQVEERDNLINVGAYLAKVDYYARFVSPTIGRTFGKGEIDRSVSNRGRPRSHRGALDNVDRPGRVEELNERLAKEAAEG